MVVVVVPLGVALALCGALNIDIDARAVTVERRRPSAGWWPRPSMVARVLLFMSEGAGPRDGTY